METTTALLPPTHSPLRKMKKKERKKKEKKKNKNTAPPPPMYTIDGVKFFSSKAELDRFVCTGFSKRSPSPKKKGPPPAATTTTPTLPLVTSPSKPNTAEQTNSIDLGGNFAHLFFTKQDERQHQLDTLAKADAARQKSDELFERTHGAGASSPKRFTTDQDQFFPSMGALDKYYRELENGQLPELMDDKERRRLAKNKKKKVAMQDRLRSAIPSWWTGMPENEKNEYEQYDLPPTPATTVMESSEDEEDIAEREREEIKIQEEEDRMEFMCEWKCKMCWKHNDPGTQEDWDAGVRESKCQVCKRPRPKKEEPAAAATPATPSTPSTPSTASTTQHQRPSHQPDGDNTTGMSLLPVSPIRGGRGPKRNDTIGVAVKYVPSKTILNADSDDADDERYHSPERLLYDTPRVERGKDGTPSMPDVTLSPCKEWSLWTSEEMKESNFKLARMILSYESDFTKLIRVTLCNCRLDPIDCTTIAHAL